MRTTYARAVSGGTGAAKTSGNYAGSLLAFKEAHDAGYTQVLWLDACDRQTIEEVSTSNMFFIIDDEVITAPLAGTILPGVTRDSVLQLCQHWGFKAVERRLTINEVVASPKGRVLKGGLRRRHRGGDQPGGPVRLPAARSIRWRTARPAPYPKGLYDEIVGIQYGHQARSLRLGGERWPKGYYL